MKVKNLLNFSFLNFSSNEKIAQEIVELVSGSAFHVYKDKRVRELVDFSNIDRVEQDRIFNELQVTVLALVILLLEQKSNFAVSNKKDTLLKLRTDVEEKFINFLLEIGIQQGFVDMWSGLIKMRCEEYRNIYEKRKRKATKFNSKLLLTVVTNGGLKHIRRGDVFPGDHLRQYILIWLEIAMEETEDIIKKNNL
ncbi:MAG: hypothetical protein WC663_03315 [Patescibacteria group bacterium]|jgi:hypothetical protein